MDSSYPLTVNLVAAVMVAVMVAVTVCATTFLRPSVSFAMIFFAAVPQKMLSSADTSKH